MSGAAVDESSSGESATTSFEYRGHTISMSGHSSGEYVMRLIRSTGTFYEIDLLEALGHLDISGGIAVDVGAHIGNHSIFFSSVLGLRTIAVEPHPANFHLLQKNLADNGIADLVESHQVALSRNEGRASLVQLVPDNTGSFKAEFSGSGDIRVTTLDSLISASARVSVLKIDVEGAEAAVLEGAMSTLTKSLPLVVAESHDGPAFNSLQRQLSPLGYEPVGVFGRSDNWVFASSESGSRVHPQMARQTLRLMAERAADRTVRARLDTISDRLRSLGLQSGEASDEIRAELTNLARSHDETVGQLMARIDSVEEALSLELGRRDKQLALWQAQYRRLSRSRLLKWLLTTKRALARIGLVSDYPIYTPDEIDHILRSEDQWGPDRP